MKKHGSPARRAAQRAHSGQGRGVRKSKRKLLTVVMVLSVGSCFFALRSYIGPATASAASPSSWLGMLSVSGPGFLRFVMEEGNLTSIRRVSASDFNGDFQVDSADFLTFSNCFNGALMTPLPDCPVPELVDVDGDRDIDSDDFLMFSNEFKKVFP